MNDQCNGLWKIKHIRAAKWLVVCGALLAGGLAVYSIAQPSGASPKTTSVEYIPQTIITGEVPTALTTGAKNSLDATNGQSVQPSTTTLTFTVAQPVVTANNVTAQLRAIRAQGATTEAELCVALPTNADWLPEVEMVVAGKSAQADHMQLLDAKNPATYSGVKRCYVYGFPLELNTQATSKGTAVTITVTRIATSIPEAITPQDCAKAQDKLKVMQPQVSFECKDNGGRTYFAVDQKPADMTDAQASHAVMDAFRESVAGPWTFVATVQ
jgi:hypothetical protein